jgi:hypothetical protein
MRKVGIVHRASLLQFLIARNQLSPTDAPAHATGLPMTFLHITNLILSLLGARKRRPDWHKTVATFQAICRFVLRRLHA